MFLLNAGVCLLFVLLVLPVAGVLPHSLVSLLSDNTLFHGASQSKLVPDEKNNSHFVCVIPTVSDPRYEIMAILLATI